jgi:hypothetical protein
MHLICHPATPCAFIDRIDVRVMRTDERAFSLRYRAIGDIDRLLLPAEQPSCRADLLWQHTCFEAFLRLQDIPSYAELNFSPSTCWAAYRFDDYRQGMMQLELPAAPSIVCQRGSREFELDVQLETPQWLATAQADLRIALASVIEDRQGRLSYWALAHPSAQPDFHHPDAFKLRS